MIYSLSDSALFLSFHPVLSLLSPSTQTDHQQEAPPPHLSWALGFCEPPTDIRDGNRRKRSRTESSRYAKSRGSICCKPAPKMIKFYIPKYLSDEYDTESSDRTSSSTPIVFPLTVVNIPVFHLFSGPGPVKHLRNISVTIGRSTAMSVLQPQRGAPADGR